MASEAHVQHQGRAAVVVDNIEHRALQVTGTPDVGTARFQGYVQVGVALFERLQGGNQPLHVVALMSHQVAAAEVKPFDLLQVVAELRAGTLDQGSGGRRVALAEGVDV